VIEEVRMEKPRYYFVGDNHRVDLDFPNLRFDYMACPYRFEAVFEHGVWRVRGLVENSNMEIPEGSQCLHYGHQIFEGMRVVTGADGKPYAFRPYDNARRMNQGALYLKGAELPEELFVRGVEEAAAANLPFVPPFGSGASLYVRPLYVGIGDNVGVKPATRFIYRVMVCPVGPYYKGGFGPEQGRSFVVSKYDRAAPRGTGHIKAGGNYASSFLPGSEARAMGYTDAIFLDPTEHKYIDEIGAANFLAFRDSALITPNSSSVLQSITRSSLLEIASEIFGWSTEERPVAVDELDDVEAAACCGTAAIITWIDRIVDGDRAWEFPFDERWQQLYDRLVGIQTATEDDPFGWRHEIPL
jgi:branched-chain amino acid aminotransferase